MKNKKEDVHFIYIIFFGIMFWLELIYHFGTYIGEKLVTFINAELKGN